MVEEGTFRQDLYYRVNVMGIQSPALRDRSEDIPQMRSISSKSIASCIKRPGSGLRPGHDFAA